MTTTIQYNSFRIDNLLGGNVARTINCDNAQRLLIEICETQRHQAKQKVTDTPTKADDIWSGDLMNAVMGSPTLSTQPQNLNGAINELILLFHTTIELSDQHYSIDSIMSTTSITEVVDHSLAKALASLPLSIYPDSGEHVTANNNKATPNQAPQSFSELVMPNNAQSLEEFCFEVRNTIDQCDKLVAAERINDDPHVVTVATVEPQTAAYTSFSLGMLSFQEEVFLDAMPLGVSIPENSF